MRIVKEIYIVKQEWNYYGNYNYKITICGNIKAAERVFEEQVKDSYEHFVKDIDDRDYYDEKDISKIEEASYAIRSDDGESYEGVYIEKREIIY